jgi:hypothetical protein
MATHCAYRVEKFILLLAFLQASLFVSNSGDLMIYGDARTVTTAGGKFTGRLVSWFPNDIDPTAAVNTT